MMSHHELAYNTSWQSVPLHPLCLPACHLSSGLVALLTAERINSDSSLHPCVLHFGETDAERSAHLMKALLSLHGDCSGMCK